MASNNQSQRDQHYQEHPWPTGNTYNRMPHVNWDFRNARDPDHLAQYQDMQKSEQQRRDEAQGRNSQMVVLDKPLPAYRPKAEFRRSVDSYAFNARWLNEQKEAAFASNEQFLRELKEQERSEPARTYEPQRSMR